MASLVLELLEDNSPQLTKELRASADFQGRANEPVFTKALKERWSRLLIVGVGEVDDGVFPSLAMSATRHAFEDLWPDAPDAKAHRASDAARLETALLRTRRCSRVSSARRSPSSEHRRETRRFLAYE